MIYHHQLLIYGLVFPKVNVTMKPWSFKFHKGLLRKTFYKTSTYGKYSNSMNVSAVESWTRLQTQLKNILLKDLSLNKIKAVVSNLNILSCKNKHMTLLVHKHFRGIISVINYTCFISVYWTICCHLIVKQWHFIKCHHSMSEMKLNIFFYIKLT